MKEGGKVEDMPLGMPQGTVRALITIMIVAFPFSYLIFNVEVPSMILNAIFLLIAFYFESRRDGEEKIKKLVKKIQHPEEYVGKKEWKPLYLPKYSVRCILILLIILILIVNLLGPNIPFESTNTLVELLVIIFIFVIGTFFREIGDLREKKKVRGKVESIEGYKSLSKYEIMEKVLDQKPSWWKQKGNSLVSILTLAAVMLALVCFTIEWDYIIFTLPIYEFSLRETLLLAISLYYGLRD